MSQQQSDEGRAAADGRDVLTFARQRFEAAKARLEDLHEEIRYNREMYLNKRIRVYWQDSANLSEDERRRVFRSGVVSNKIDTMTAIQTDNRPKIFINPETPAAGVAPPPLAGALERLGGVQGLADTLTRVFDNWWEENRIDEELYALVKEARVCGAAVAKVRWAPELKNSAGDVVFERVPIEDFYPDPDARDIGDCRFCFHSRVMDVDDIRKKYGVDDIEPDRDYSILYPGRGKFDDDDGLKYRVPRAVLVEGYFKDDATSTVAGEDGATETIPQYPSGRIITFCGHSILRDEPNPYPGFPFVKFTANPVPGGFFGKSDVRDLAPIQENADMIMQQIMANMRLVGNAKLIYEEGAITDPDNISNVIAEKIQVSNMSGIQFVPPQAAAADGYAVYDRMMKLADEISGIHDVSEGRAPGGIQSGRAIISLQEGANRRIRPSARFFEGFLKKAGEKILWLILRHYKKGRVYRFGDGRRETATLPINLAALGVTFDIAIGPNSTLPTDRTAKANLALALLGTPAEDGLPVVDREYVLDNLDLPGRDELLRRLALIKQAQSMNLPPEALAQLAGANGAAQMPADPNDAVNEMLRGI